MVSGFGGAFAGGALGGAYGNVIGQAVVEILVDNSGLEKSLTAQQKLLGSLALGGFGASLVAATAYETALARVAKTTNLEGKELAALGAEFRQMATREIPMSAAALAGLGATAAQLGVDAEHLATFTEAVAKLGTATNIVGEQGAQDLARFINVMGESTTNVERIGSSIVDLGNNSATTEAEILALGLRTAAAGRQFGLTTGEVLGLSAAASSLGLEAEAGGTALSRVMLAIYADSKRGAEALHGYADVVGVTADEYLQMVQNSPQEALVRFIAGLGTAEARGLNVIAMLDDLSFGNVRVRDALLRLAGAQDLMTGSIERGSRAYEENTALQQEFDLFAGTTENRIRMLVNQLAELGLAIGGLAVGPLGLLVDTMSFLVKGVSDLPPELQLTALGLVAWITLSAPAAASAAALTKAMKNLHAAIALGPQQWALYARALTGPTGIVAGLGAVLLIANGVTQRTTGHGLIEWMFGDPRAADAAAEAVKKVRAEVELSQQLGHRPLDLMEHTKRRAEELVTVYRQLAQEAKELQSKGDDWRDEKRGMENMQAAVTSLVEEMLRLGVPFTELHAFFNTLPEPVQKSVLEIDEFKVKLGVFRENLRGSGSEAEALTASLGDVDFAEAGRAAAEAADDTKAYAQALLDLNPRLLATGLAAQLMAAGIRRGGGEYRAFVAGLSEQVARMWRESLELEGLAAEILALVPEDSRSGGARQQTPAERLLGEFDALGERAPRALREVVSELGLYRAAAAAAGDTTAVALIDRLLAMEPTVSEVNGAVRALQAQYGDLADAAKQSAQQQQRAVEDVAKAWEKMRSTAGRSADVLGNAVVEALRRQAQAAHDQQLAFYESQRTLLQAASDQRLADFRAAADALLAPLQAELDALSASDRTDELAEIERQLQVAYDPRRRAELEQRRVQVERRIRADELRSKMREIEDGHRQQQDAEREHLRRQLEAVADQERRARDEFERTTEAWRLQLKARELVLSSSVAEIAVLIGDYYPEWQLAGRGLGEAIVDGLTGPVESWLAGLRAQLSALGVGGFRAQVLETAAGKAVGQGMDPSAVSAHLMQIARLDAGGAPAFVTRSLRDEFLDRFGFAAPLADGGVITEPTFAYLGEVGSARPEIVSPERILRNITSQEMSRALDHDGGREVVIYQTIEIDGQVIDRRVERHIERDLTQGAFEHGFRGT